ncbi:hypothetical protein OSB04_004382 [Centaurea solstitialis]|uniref:AB hydrolase-1 domain-containing protein n=1 Tax=Centaurea solstitialis TaxID=347529 RepID=A0AA38WVX4_9ASTR|nr:hypothetical protein OSB04_004382 [Centaurea solstitialis]
MLSTIRSLRLHSRLLSLYAAVKRLPIEFAELLLSAYFCYCNLSPCTVDLDDRQTSVHFWAPYHRRCNKPNLVLVHGYGGNSKWQFVLQTLDWSFGAGFGRIQYMGMGIGIHFPAGQVAQLSRDFNVYMPDLVFFGRSYSTRTERTDAFQAKCVCDGMRKLGVERFSVYGISYGGFVAFRMAEMAEEAVEKVVIVSSAIVCTEDQKFEHLKKIGGNLVDMLVPEKPEDIRKLCEMSMYKSNVSKWFPDFFLKGFIAADGWKMEKRQLVEHLLSKQPDLHLPLLTQETLIIWGEKDNIFPSHLAHQLHRHLGPKSKVEIIKDVGHAANMEAPYSINKFVTTFLCGDRC